MIKKNRIFCLFILVLLLVGSCKIDRFKALARLVLNPACGVSDIGGSSTFSAKGYDKDGNEVTELTPSDLTWSVQVQGVATVNGGNVQSLDGGNTKIYAECSGVKGDAQLFVNPINSTHNCRPYEWYQTQMNTGPSSGNNCGPTSTYMAIAWYRNSTQNLPTVEEIRNRHYNNGGWWYTTDIDESLTYYQIPFAYHTVFSAAAIQGCLERGHIVLLCAEMKWVTYNRHSFFDRFYTYSSGHFLIVKGMANDGSYFIVYDPNSWSGDYYTDGMAMGRNRFYLSSELADAATNWWPYLFEIGASTLTSTADRRILPAGRAGPRITQ